MESIVHFKFVDEVFSLDEEPISNDAFKLAMAENHSARVKRDTTVVSEDIEKNTISLKSYTFDKLLVNVDKLKRKRFKILKKCMTSITINKGNGDFSVYHNEKRGRRKSYYVRKNLTNVRIKEIIRGFQCKPEHEEAIKIFYTLLGYPKDIYTFDFFLLYFFNKQYYNKIVTTSLEYFPWVNFLHKKNINIPDFNLINFSEKIIRINKKKYYNLPFIKIIQDYFSIENECLVKSWLSEVLDDSINDETFFIKDRHGYLDFSIIGGHIYKAPSLLLELLNFYGKKETTSDNSIINYHSSYIDSEKAQKYVFDILKLYNFTADDVIGVLNTNLRHNWYNLIDLLYLFTRFNIKLNIPSLAYLNSNYKDYLSLLPALYDAKNKTGIVKYNTEFLKRIKRYSKKGEKVSIVYDDLYFEQNGNLEYLIGTANPILKVNSNNYTLDFRSGKSNERIFGGTSSLTIALMMNKNKLIDAMDIRYLYSKPHFESYFKENFSCDATQLIEYVQ